LQFNVKLIFRCGFSFNSLLKKSASIFPKAAAGILVESHIIHYTCMRTLSCLVVMDLITTATAPYFAASIAPFTL